MTVAEKCFQIQFLNSLVYLAETFEIRIGLIRAFKIQTLQCNDAQLRIIIDFISVSRRYDYCKYYTFLELS